jgi:hypothetical protein
MTLGTIVLALVGYQPVFTAETQMQLTSIKRLGTSVGDATNSTVITMTSAGDYLIDVKCNPTQGGSGQIFIHLYQSGTIIASQSTSYHTSYPITLLHIRVVVTGVLVGDTFYITMYTSGATAYINTGSADNNMFIQKLSDPGIVTFRNTNADQLVGATELKPVPITQLSSVGSSNPTLASNQYTVAVSGLYEFCYSATAIGNNFEGYMGMGIGGGYNSYERIGVTGSLYRYAMVIQYVGYLTAGQIVNIYGAHMNFYNKTTYARGYIRRLAESVVTTWSLTTGQALGTSDAALTFTAATAYGVNPVTVSPGASPTQGQITINSAGVYSIGFTGHLKNVETNYVIFILKELSTGAWIRTSFGQPYGFYGYNIDLVIDAAAGKQFQLNGYRNSQPTPMPTLADVAAMLCYAMKIGETHTETCGLVTVENDNCVRLHRGTYQYVATHDRYEQFMHLMVATCIGDNSLGTSKDGRALSSFVVSNLYDAASPTMQPSYNLMAYQYNCRYVADQTTAHTGPFTTTETPYSTFSPTQSQYATDLAGQPVVSCGPLYVLSSFQLKYNSGTARIWYEYYCLPPKVPGGYGLQCTAYTTSYASTGGYSTNYLDGIPVSCPVTGEVLQSFQLQLSGATMRYSFTCCMAVVSG